MNTGHQSEEKHKDVTCRQHFCILPPATWGRMPARHGDRQWKIQTVKSQIQGY